MLGGSDDELRWVAVALEALVERLEVTRRPVPQAVTDLRQQLRGIVSVSVPQAPSIRAKVADLGHVANVLATPVLLDFDDAAAVLRTSRSTIERRVEAGDLQAVKLGGSSRIRLTDLEEFVAGLPAAGRRGGAVPVPRSDGAEGPGPRPDEEAAA